MRRHESAHGAIAAVVPVDLPTMGGGRIGIYPQTGDRQMIHVTVPNLRCGGCEATVRSQLERLPGVQSVEVDRATKAVSVGGTAEQQVIL